MSLLRRGGGLFEQDSLKDKVEQAGLSAQPTSARAAAGVGATPMQQAMAGSDARKQSLIREEDTAPQVDQRVFERQAGPRESALAVEQTARQKAEDLRSLGSLGTRVQSHIEQKIAQAHQAAQVTGQVQEDWLATELGLTAETARYQPAGSPYHVAREHLQTLAQNPTPQAMEQAYVDLMNMGIEANTARSLVDHSTAHIGVSLADVMQDDILMGDLDVTTLGFNNLDEVANLLDVPADQLMGMSVSEIAMTAEFMRQDELNRVNAMRAEIAGMPLGDPRRAQMVQQLQDMGYAGVTGAEITAQEAVRDLQMADVVTVGGQPMTVAEALSDANISSLVEQYLQASPEEQDRLLPPEVYGDLRQWVDQNREALAHAAVGLTEGLRDVVTTQEYVADLSTPMVGVNISPDLLSDLAGIDLSQALTREQFEAAQQAIYDSGLGAIMQQPSEESRNILNKIGPDNWDFVKNATAVELEEAHQTAEMVRADPELAGVVGLDSTVDFVVNPAQSALIRQYADVLEQVDSTWKGDENFMSLSPEDMQHLINNPDRYTDFREYHALEQELGQAQTVDDVLRTLIGLSVEDLEVKANKLEQRARLFPEERATLEALQSFMQSVDADDHQSLVDRLLGMTNQDDVIQGGDGAASLQDKIARLGQLSQTLKEVPEIDRLAGYQQSLIEMLDDNKITLDELEGLKPSDVEKIYNRLGDMEGVDTSDIPKTFDKWYDDHVLWPQEQEAYNKMIENQRRIQGNAATANAATITQLQRMGNNPNTSSPEAIQRVADEHLRKLNRRILQLWNAQRNPQRSSSIGNRKQQQDLGPMIDELQKLRQQVVNASKSAISQWHTGQERVLAEGSQPVIR